MLKFCVPFGRQLYSSLITTKCTDLLPDGAVLFRRLLSQAACCRRTDNIVTRVYSVNSLLDVRFASLSTALLPPSTVLYSNLLPNCSSCNISRPTSLHRTTGVSTVDLCHCWHHCHCYQTGPVKRHEENDTVHRKPVVNCKKHRSVSNIIQQLREDMILTVPNVLTLCRMLMAPVLGYMVLTNAYMSACVVFVVAGVTDLLDGYIARNFANQTSELGSFIDPLADKLLVSILFVSLTAVDLIPLALTGLVIFRDVCLMSAGFYIRYISLAAPRTLKRYFDLTNPTARLQPTAVSKLNTAVQLSLVAITLAAPVFEYVDHPALHALWYVTATTTLVSGIGYIFAKGTFKLLQDAHKKKPL